MRTVQIAILGTFNPSFRPHQVVKMSLENVGHSQGISIKTEWMATDRLNQFNNLPALLDGFDGIWCSPGSPYKSLEGALNGIRYARENNIPFLGTCAGFQHLILEYARNVLGFEKANSGEYETDGGPLFITPLACNLSGQTLEIDVMENTLAFRIWGRISIKEHYYCRFGLNPVYLSDIQNSELCISGWDDTREPRIIELPNHPFFIGTLFVPGDDLLFGNQFSDTPKVHPLIQSFAEASHRCSYPHLQQPS